MRTSSDVWLSRILIIAVAGILGLAAGHSARAQLTNSTRPLPPNEYTVDTARVNATFNTSTLAPQADNTWTSTSAVNAPLGRKQYSTVWTGSEMIVWGGNTGYGTPLLNTGARYNPKTDTWQPLPTIGAPVGRNGQGIWTGKEMIVGLGGGGRYNPTTNSWKSITTTGAPSSNDIVVWTGHEMLVWGRSGTGARYDPALDIWKPISTTNAPNNSTGWAAEAGVWDGREMIVYFFCSPAMFVNCGGYTGSGGLYDPDTDTWHIMSMDAPILGENPAAVVWTGKEMIIYGGIESNTTIGVQNTGGKYNPTTDTWTIIPSLSNFQHVNVAEAIWTGADVIFAGQLTDNSSGVYVARYTPESNEWHMLPDPPCIFGSFVWTGNEILLWGTEEYSYCNHPPDNAARSFTPPYQTTQNFNTDMDTYIAQGYPTQASGSDPLMFAGYDPQYKYYTERLLVHFPIGIPSRVNVGQAEAYMYMYAYNTGAASMNITANRATSSWNESSTWQNAANSFDPSSLSTVSIAHGFGWYGWNISNAATIWHNGGPNYGLMFNGNTSGKRNERVFLTRESGTTAIPYLAITYTDPAYNADTTAPTSQVTVSPLQSATSPLLVQWNGSDQGHGVQSFDVQVRDNITNTWSDWYSWATGQSANFTGEAGHTYCFHSRARDYANNIGVWSNEVCSTLYAYLISGQIVDQRHTPLAAVSFNIVAQPLTTTLNIYNSKFSIYLADNMSRQVLATHLGYTSPPTATIDVTSTAHYDLVMQPTDNIVQNPNFELGLSDWTVGGNLLISTTYTSHSGNFAVELNQDNAAGEGDAVISQILEIPASDYAQTLSFLYTLSATTAMSNSYLQVDIQTATTNTTVLTTSTACSDWCHHWLDVDAWQGQVITLEFDLHQAADELVGAKIDEVTLGSWLTPIISDIQPAHIYSNVTRTITLTGINFDAIPQSSSYITGPVLSLNGADLSTYWIDSSTVTATIPISFPIGIYDVWLQNPGGQASVLPHAFQVGSVVYLPLVAKAP